MGNEHSREYKKAVGEVGGVTGGATKILELITEHALACGVSDIHIEKREKGSSVRFRIDGILQEIKPPTAFSHEALIACIKVLARLRTDIRTLPQDGRYTFKHASMPADARVSLVPAYWGEKAVIRLLVKPTGRRALVDLGFSRGDEAVIQRTMRQPDGLVLVTGPTGSGKTTTLYEMLQAISERSISAVSLEDPIEYALDRVTQIPVHHRHNFTFSTALRALLRQDPDVIMVGEIRDAETAELAANSALTGHLVLSTLHTLDAVRTVVRLMTMGVPEYILAPALSLIISQRLARKVCQKCISEKPIPAWCLEMMRAKNKKFQNAHLTHQNVGAGCRECSHTGYKGRIGIYEMMVVDDGVRELIRTRAGADTISQYLQQAGWIDIVDSGVAAVASGHTNFEEIFRVIQV